MDDINLFHIRSARRAICNGIKTYVITSSVYNSDFYLNEYMYLEALMYNHFSPIFNFYLCMGLEG